MHTRSAILLAVALSLRSEEHTSELQSRSDLVCRLLLEKKKNNRIDLWIVSANEHLAHDDAAHEQRRTETQVLGQRNLLLNQMNDNLKNLYPHRLSRLTTY